MPVKGFKSITVPENLYVQLQGYYERNRDELRAKYGIRSFTAFACYSMKSHLDHLKREQPIRVIMVDDEQPLLDLTKEFLEKLEERFQVDAVLSTKEALQKLSEEEYDVVVSDYKMPDMDGLEFLRELRRQGRTIPFIFFTGRGGEKVAAAAFREEANGYVIRGGPPESTYAELADSIKRNVANMRRLE